MIVVAQCVHTARENRVFQERRIGFHDTATRTQAHPAASRPLQDFPEGSVHHGYEFVAPLDSKGHIDPQLWQKYRQHCGVRRFWNGDDEQIGRLVHKPGGAEHARWVFDYDPDSSEDDEAGYRLGVHAFMPGEYVPAGLRFGSTCVVPARSSPEYA